MGDQLFAAPLRHRFRFSDDVAAVFDEMATRSVPGYWEIQRLLADLACERVHDGQIYDIGCSTGNTIEAVLSSSPEGEFIVVGIDVSRPMLAIARAKIAASEQRHRVRFVHADVATLSRLPFGPSTVTIASLVFQFIRPLRRLDVIARLRQQSMPDGTLLLVEKTFQPDELENQRLEQEHHEFKLQNGYSEFEIASKRRALDGVLIPFSRDENVEMLKRSGFVNVEVIDSWLAFDLYRAVVPMSRM